MGKYTNQASSYMHGMKMVVASLEDVKALIEEATLIISNEDNKDILNYHVGNLNEEIKKMIDSLILKCTSLPVNIMNKAKEIDWRIEQETLRRKLEETKLNETEEKGETN